MGMNVMVADIDAVALADAVESLRNVGPDVQGVTCDVTDQLSVDHAATVTYGVFGNVHVVCNNAGVSAAGGIDNISLENWRWVIDVNVMGVLHGVRTFLPHIRAHGEGGHIVNTASIAGMLSGLGFEPYTASKFAIVAMSEGLMSQLKQLGIGVSVLCPGYVDTRLSTSERNRPARYGQTQLLDPTSPASACMAEMAARIRAGQDPNDVAKLVIDAIRADEFYIFTHPGLGTDIDRRFAFIQAAMGKAAGRGAK
jgi:NAD(P)-dependent dehydrogenase (short-subunit alcohol dehydrogenase family)